MTLRLPPQTLLACLLLLLLLLKCESRRGMPIEKDDADDMEIVSDRLARRETLRVLLGNGNGQGGPFDTELPLTEVAPSMLARREALVVGAAVVLVLVLVLARVRGEKIDWFPDSSPPARRWLSLLLLE